MVLTCFSAARDLLSMHCMYIGCCCETTRTHGMFPAAHNFGSQHECLLSLTFFLEAMTTITQVRAAQEEVGTRMCFCCCSLSALYLSHHCHFQFLQGRMHPTVARHLGTQGRIEKLQKELRALNRRQNLLKYACRRIIRYVCCLVCAAPLIPKVVLHR